MAVQFDSAPLTLVKGGGMPRAAVPSGAMPSSAAPGFGDVLQTVLASIEQTAGVANTAVAAMVEGTGDVHDAMLALQRAETTFQLALQVRNKLMSAYQDIMRMSI